MTERNESMAIYRILDRSKFYSRVLSFSDPPRRARGRQGHQEAPRQADARQQHQIPPAWTRPEINRITFQSIQTKHFLPLSYVLILSGFVYAYPEIIEN